jgi:DNA polymerase type B, organellar and viral
VETKRIAEIMKDEYTLRASIRPLKGEGEQEKGEGWAIVGFDTEFNTREQYTISYQLYFDESQKEIIEGPRQLGLRDIANRAYELSGKVYRKICIPAFFNTAELSQLAQPFWKEKNVQFYKVHPSGLFHIEGEGTGFHFLFYDLWHFFASYENSSLDRVATDFGFQKYEYKVDNLSLENLRDPAFREYAINDARLCVQVFKKLDETYRQVNKVSILARPTPANAAQTSFKLNYLRKEVRAPHRSIRRLAMRANWAGRVECGFVGNNDNVHEHDADSLYPRSVLLLPNLPSANDWNIRTPSYFDGIEGFIEAKFEFPKDEEWPCLPVFESKRLLFPLSGDTSCTIGEFRAALSRGVRYSIKSCAFYTTGEHDEYHSFIQDNIDLKEGEGETNKALRAIAKLNMNSSIGKFIQNKGGIDYEEAAKFIRDKPGIEDWMVPLIYANLLRSYDLDFNDSVRLGSSFYPEWHTLILGKAREVMAWAIYNSQAYPKILMISTDSLHVRTKELGPTNIKFNHKLGPADFVSVRSRLHLAMEHDTGKVLKVAHHGMPVSSKRAAEIILSAHGKDVIELERRGKLTLRESVITGRPFGTDKFDPDYKVSLRPDSKRIIDDEGWTHPLKAAI